MLFSNCYYDRRQITNERGVSMSIQKKIISILFATLIVLSLSACGNDLLHDEENGKGELIEAVQPFNRVVINISEGGEPNVTIQPVGAMGAGLFINKYDTDNTEPLDSILTQTYKLEDLLDYFGKFQVNESPIHGFPNNIHNMSIDQVNASFPIECLRHIDGKYYSVYEVREGGFFYVFWVMISNSSSDMGQEPDDYSVYFTAYLSSLRRLSDFDSLVVGSSTAEDVSFIDPAFELCFLLSSQTSSYSLLEDGSILEICYDFGSELESRNDLIVTSIRVVSRSDSVPKLSLILPEDLPNMA